MIGRVINWIKTHKLTSALIIIVAFLLFGSNSPIPSVSKSTSTYSGEMAVSALPPSANGASRQFEAAPRPDITDRKVITTSNFSLLVKNVTESVEKVKSKTTELLGYVINTNINRSEFGETAYIDIRVPSNKMDEVTTFLRGLAVKVVSENVKGTDITDQYVDVQERIKQLETEKAAFQEFFKKAQNVTEMMQIQESIFSVQDQIDSYKGQIKYMEGASETTKLSIAISTDELGLPYSPAQPWRPEAILKQAVRSFVGTLQAIGTLAIWVGVYLPLIAVVVAVYLFIKRRKKVQ